jgi:hypothetical protein
MGNNDLIGRWRQGDLAACERLVDGISPEVCAHFATHVLELCAATTQNAPGPVDGVIQAGQKNWGVGHRAFDAVRDLVLQIEHAGEESRESGFLLLFVAENAARVIYNASSPADPFDDDSPAYFMAAVSDFMRASGSDSSDMARLFGEVVALLRVAGDPDRRDPDRG